MTNNSAPANPFTTRLEGPAPEVSVTKDMIKRGLIAAPVLIAICGGHLGHRRRMVVRLRHRPHPGQLRHRCRV